VSTRTVMTTAVVIVLILAFGALLVPTWMAALNSLGISPLERRSRRHRFQGRKNETTTISRISGGGGWFAN
jgi:hypothetical protein